MWIFLEDQVGTLVSLLVHVRDPEDHTQGLKQASPVSASELYPNCRFREF